MLAFRRWRIGNTTAQSLSNDNRTAKRFAVKIVNSAEIAANLVHSSESESSLPQRAQNEVVSHAMACHATAQKVLQSPCSYIHYYRLPKAFQRIFVQNNPK